MGDGGGETRQRHGRGTPEHGIGLGILGCEWRVWVGYRRVGELVAMLQGSGGWARAEMMMAGYGFLEFAVSSVMVEVSKIGIGRGKKLPLLFDCGLQ
ncbi:hypothetical protein M0R45_009068 [Rubus argutus]|uniref:Uncharacterized protein n=1 Tax=Rubus argutus TaxID=59490 RepID=A0AAW1Y3W6_RUBAR